MFFEAPSIECRKTTCNVTKVTYNMYSCDTSCMSREMVEMDGRNSAKCKKSKRRDMMGISEFVNDNRTKKWNSIVFFKRAQNGQNRVVGLTGEAVAGVFQF